MRLLALARYRFLISIRKAGGTLGGIAVGILPFVVLMTRAFVPDTVYERYVAPEALQFSAFWVPFICILQALVVATAELTFGMRSRRAGAGKSDSFELVPVSPTLRFWGDAIGFFATGLTLHVCLLPLLAVAIALSPLSSAAFVFIEMVTVAILLFGACTASWTLRTSTSQANPAIIVFLILLSGIVLLTARLEEFREGLGQFFNESDIRGLRVMVNAFDSFAMTGILMALVYLAYIAFYYLHSVRKMEEA